MLDEKFLMHPIDDTETAMHRTRMLVTEEYPGLYNFRVTADEIQ